MRLLLLTLALVLMGQDCEPTEPPTPPEGGSDYCYGNDYSISKSLQYAVSNDGIIGAEYGAILNGIPSGDRRSTVQVLFGQSYCSGVILDQHHVLTAGHCGYASTTVHMIKAGDQTFTAESHVVHPDYLKYVANPADREARKADLMVIYVPDDLPGPYVGYQFYESGVAPVCSGLVAQGWGKSETPGAQLRETKYVITEEKPKLLTSIADPTAGKICFGDSGGPLYADVAGKARLAGITTTTFSQDCLVGGNHVKVFAFRDWILSITGQT